MSYLSILLENLDLTSTLFGIVVILIATYIKRISDSYKYFEKIGLKNPPVKFFSGNLFEITNFRAPKMFRKWTKEYGKTYGYFEGHLPILVTSDIEIINEIFVKQFGNFIAKKIRPLDFPDDAERVSLISATETRWKNMRNIMNPAFSSLKLRKMNPILDDMTQKLIRNIQKYSDNRTCDVRDLLKRFTMDTIWNCAFGINVDTQTTDKEIILMQKTEDVVKTILKYNFPMFLTTLFHEFRNIIVKIYWSMQMILYKHQNLPFASKYLNPIFWLRETSIKFINKRIGEQGSKNDFLNLLIESYTENIDELQKIENFDAEKSILKKKLSIEEIKMNLGVVILGGSDTTATSLGYCFHALAKYPEEQTKLLAEINEHIPEGDFNTDNVKQLNYMICFVDEVLRLHPVGTNAINRRCVKSTVVKDIPISKDLAIQIDVESLHHDPELWGPVDPEMFYPERFSKDNKRHQLAFLGFSGGPRNCIGMKFAYIVMLLALTKVLRLYEIQKGDNFIDCLSYYDGFVRVVDDPINVKFIKRSE